MYAAVARDRIRWDRATGAPFVFPSFCPIDGGHTIQQDLEAYAILVDQVIADLGNKVKEALGPRPGQQRECDFGAIVEGLERESLSSPDVGSAYEMYIRRRRALRGQEGFNASVRQAISGPLHRFLDGRQEPGNLAERMALVADLIGFLSNPDDEAAQGRTASIVRLSLSLGHRLYRERLEQREVDANFGHTYPLIAQNLLHERYDRTGAALGGGGQGAVYRGTMRGSGDEVAVKTQNYPFNGSLYVLIRFLLEAIAIRLLSSHPAAVPFVGWGVRQTNDTDSIELILVTALMKGSLADWLDAKGPFAAKPKPTDKVILLYGIARSLAFAHQERLRLGHRDLKPLNIFVDANNRPRVADFGSVRSGEMRETELMCTAYYCAPEVHRSQGEDLDPPAMDVFSYCVMCYVVIMAALPSVLYHYNQLVVPRLDNFMMVGPATGRGSAVADNLRELIHKGLHEDPAKRPTVDQIVQAWEAAEQPIQGARMEAFRTYKEELDAGEAVMDLADARKLAETLRHKLTQDALQGWINTPPYSELTAFDQFTAIFSRAMEPPRSDNSDLLDDLPMLLALQRSWDRFGDLDPEILRRSQESVRDRALPASGKQGEISEVDEAH
jgi:serine/threonine protein kinase